MLHLKSLLVTVPGGWTFKDPTSGFVSDANIFIDLVAKVAAHRRNNNYPPLTEAEIEDQICRSLSPASQAEFCEGGARLPATIPWTDVMSFLKTAAAWLGSRMAQVPQAEAERRAAICAQCPFNRGLAGGCAACQTAVNILRSEVLHASTSHDSELQACAICNCDNRATVHIPIATLETVPHDFSVAGWCWRNKNGSNYKI